MFKFNPTEIKWTINYGENRELPGTAVERRLAVLVLDVHAGTAVEQELHHVLTAAGHRQK